MDILEILTQYTQKFIKQQKRAVSSSALPNIRKQQVLKEVGRRILGVKTYPKKTNNQTKTTKNKQKQPKTNKNPQGSILSDLIDTSQHAPTNNMVKPQKREVASTYTSNPPLERGVSFQNSDKRGGGREGRGMRHHSMMTTSHGQLPRGAPPPSPSPSPSPSQSSQSSSVSFKAHGDLPPQDDLNRFFFFFFFFLLFLLFLLFF